HTCTSNSRCRKMEEDARPQPRSRTLMPGRRSSAGASHSASQSAFAPPLAFAKTHSGWYRDARGNWSEISRPSRGMASSFLSEYSDRRTAATSTLLLRLAGLGQRLHVRRRQHLLRPPLRPLRVNPDVTIADVQCRADCAFQFAGTEVVLREVP